MGRRFLIGVAALVALAFVPLPRACDPRAEELPASAYGELARYADTRTRGEVEAALRVIDPEGGLAPYLTLGDAALEVRLRPGDRAPAVRVPLRAHAAPARAWPRQRIALDPGHLGGAWSQIEQRHVSLGGGPPVREGDLNWGVARLAERALVARGKQVQLVRPPPPAVPFDAGADPHFDAALELRLWLATRETEIPWRAPYWTFDLWRAGQRHARERPFELYNHYDLRRRAAAAAGFAADVTLSLHHDWCHDDRNGVFVFVQGSFQRAELITASQRFWAVRRLLDGTLDESARLASTVAAALMRRLALPALPRPYVDRHFSGWVPVDPGRGVYARNLAVSRRAPGVVVLVEGPCMNDPAEYRRLQGTELEIDGRRYPARLAPYADAVVEALTEPAPL